MVVSQGIVVFPQGCWNHQNYPQWLWWALEALAEGLSFAKDLSKNAHHKCYHAYKPKRDNSRG